MDNAEYENEVIRRVVEAIADVFGSVNGAAKAAAIPYATLDRKLKGGASFTIAELRRLARATGRSPSDFLPGDAALARPEKAAA